MNRQIFIINCNRCVPGRMCKDPDGAGKIILVGNTELELVVEEQTHFIAQCPNGDPHFTGRTGRHISAGKGLLQDVPFVHADSLCMDHPITGQRETIVSDGVTAYEKSVFIICAAEMRARSDFDVEIVKGKFLAEIDVIDFGLYSDG